MQSTTTGRLLYRTVSNPDLRLGLTLKGDETWKRRDHEATPNELQEDVNKIFNSRGWGITRPAAANNFYDGHGSTDKTLLTHWQIETLRAIQAELASHTPEQYGIQRGSVQIRRASQPQLDDDFDGASPTATKANKAAKSPRASFWNAAPEASGSVAAVNSMVLDSEGAFRQMQLPVTAANLSKIYLDAHNYRITWQSAVEKTLALLTTVYGSTNKKGRSDTTQAIYNRCFELLMDGCYARRWNYFLRESLIDATQNLGLKYRRSRPRRAINSNTSSTTSVPTSAVSEVLSQVIKQLNEVPDSHWRIPKDKMKMLNQTLQLETFPKSDAMRTAALHAVVHELIACRETITYFWRNGSKLYQHINKILYTIITGVLPDNSIAPNDIDTLVKTFIKTGRVEDFFTPFTPAARRSNAQRYLQRIARTTEVDQPDPQDNKSKDELLRDAQQTLQRELETTNFHQGWGARLLAFITKAEHNTLEITSSDNTPEF